MAIIPRAYLLNRHDIDAASDLELMCILEQERGNGRDEYPIRPVWNSMPAGVVFQHAWAGFEKDRGTLKYRCPARVYDLECRSMPLCPGAGTHYGKIVRIDIDMDRRMFTPTAGDTAAWERACDRRTAV